MAIVEKGVKQPHGKPGEDDHKIDWLLPLARYEAPWQPPEGVCGECGAAIGLVPSTFCHWCGCKVHTTCIRDEATRDLTFYCMKCQVNAES